MLSSSAGGDSTTDHFEAEHVEDDCATDCRGNSQPVLEGAVLEGAVLEGAVLEGAVLEGAVLEGAVLEGAVYLVDDVLGTSPPSIPGQTATVIIAFSDPGMDYADIGSLSSDLPCESESSEVYLGFDLGEVEAGDVHADPRLTLRPTEASRLESIGRYSVALGAEPAVTRSPHPPQPHPSPTTPLSPASSPRHRVCAPLPVSALRFACRPEWGAASTARPADRAWTPRPGS